MFEQCRTSSCCSILLGQRSFVDRKAGWNAIPMWAKMAAAAAVVAAVLVAIIVPIVILSGGGKY